MLIKVCFICGTESPHPFIPGTDHYEMYDSCDKCLRESESESESVEDDSDLPVLY